MSERNETEVEWMERATSFLTIKGIQEADNVINKLDKIGRGKMERLLDGDIKSNEKNYFVELFELFTDIHPEWKNDLVGEKRKADNEKVNLFWSQFTSEQIKRIMVIRKHNSGLCYLHSVVVMEHYLIAISTGGEKSSTYDIGLYEGHVLTGSKLLDFLLNDEGGSSQNTLYEMCGLKSVKDTDPYNIPNPRALPLSYKETCEKVLELVALSPALISTFRVYPDFCKANAVSFSGTPEPLPDSTDKIEMHSMVLIGARKTSQGDYLFLMQNWWEGRYFIEVSGEYLYHCEAKITFVKKAITRRADLSTFLCDALYAETSADAAETLFERCRCRCSAGVEKVQDHSKTSRLPIF